MFNLKSASAFVLDIMANCPELDEPTLTKLISLSRIEFVEGNSVIKTAAVYNHRGFVLSFNKNFIENQLENHLECGFLLAHELSHLLFNHLNKEVQDFFDKEFKDFSKSACRFIANIVLDCQINASLYHAFKDPGYIAFPERFYSDYGMLKQDLDAEKEKLKILEEKLLENPNKANSKIAVKMEEDKVTDVSFAEYIEGIKVNIALKELKLSAVVDKEESTEMPYCFLRPHSTPPEEFKEAYDKLYSVNGITTEDLVTALKPWFEKEAENRQSRKQILDKLLGNHGSSGSASDEDQELSDEISDALGDFGKSIEKKLEESAEGKNKGKGDKEKEEGEGKEGEDKEQQKGRKAGTGERLKLLKVALDRNSRSKELRRQANKNFVTSPSKRIFNAISDMSGKKSTRTVIPNFYDSRTSALYSLGKLPVFHKAQMAGNTAKVACYVDVSGSQEHVLKHVFPAVYKLKREIGEKVYCFSTLISETNLNQLMKGEYHSTGGTDFNPVAEHILRNNFSKVLILTDGEAYLNDMFISKLKQRGVKVTVGWTVSNPRTQPLNSILKKEFYVF